MFAHNIFNNIVIFERLTSSIVFVRCNGHSDQNNLYIDHKTVDVLVPSGIMYIATAHLT